MFFGVAVKALLIVAQFLPFAPARQLFSERRIARKNVGEFVAREPL